MSASAVPAPVQKLGFTEIATKDVEAVVAHFTDVLSFAVTHREGPTAYLTTGPDHHCLVVSPGDPHGRASIGMVLQGDLGEAEQALRSGGVDVDRRRDPQPGINEALIIKEATTGIPIVLYETMAQVDVKTVLGPRPTKLGHVASYGPSIAEIRSFYEQVLGFRWSDQVADFFIFMRCNADHHAVNVMESTKHVGLHHVAYEARDFVHLKDILDQLAQHDVRLNWGPGRHGPGHNIFSYHVDPDGNTIEIFTEIDHILDERNPQWEPRPWHEEFPMGPKFWPLQPSTANQWGPMNMEQLDH